MTRIELLLAAAVLLGAAAPAAAQNIYDDRCTYNRESYPEGAQMCQSGQLMRCEDGAWTPMGDCPNEPMPSPNPGGGDTDAEEDGD